MLKCNEAKCKTKEVTPSQVRKRAAATGLVYSCPGCGGPLTSDDPTTPATKPPRDIKITKSDPKKNKPPAKRAPKAEAKPEPTPERAAPRGAAPAADTTPKPRGSRRGRMGDTE